VHLKRSAQGRIQARASQTQQTALLHDWHMK